MSEIGHNQRHRSRVRFAITLQLNVSVLETSYDSATRQNADADIGRFWRQQGFDRQQGSVYFGDETVDVVRCQLAVQQLTAEFDWFAPSVTDIRMLRIEENNALMPAVEPVLKMKQGQRKGRKS